MIADSASCGDGEEDNGASGSNVDDEFSVNVWAVNNFLIFCYLVYSSYCSFYSIMG